MPRGKKAEPTQANDDNVLKQAQAHAEPDLPKKDMDDLQKEAGKLDKTNFDTIEDKIVAVREYTNNIVKLAEKVREASGRVSNILETKYRTAFNYLHQLMNEYANINKTDGYKILIERRGVDANGFLVINCANENEATCFADDLRSAIKGYIEGGQDKILSVASTESKDTVLAEILASTVAGYGIQKYEKLAEYKPEKELYPLDRLCQPGIVGQAENGPLRLVN